MTAEIKQCTREPMHCWHDAGAPIAFSPGMTIASGMLTNRPTVCCWCGQKGFSFNGVPFQPHGSHHPPNYFITKDGETTGFYNPPR